METFTINSINEDGSVDVTFSSDSKKQNLSGLPIVGDKEALNTALSNYAVAYKNGLNVIEKPQASTEVIALVGKPQTVDITEK